MIGWNIVLNMQEIWDLICKTSIDANTMPLWYNIEDRTASYLIRYSIHSRFFQEVGTVTCFIACLQMEKMKWLILLKYRRWNNSRTVSKNAYVRIRRVRYLHIDEIFLWKRIHTAILLILTAIKKQYEHQSDDKCQSKSNVLRNVARLFSWWHLFI